MKSHKESTFEIPKAIDRKKFLLLKPILNETIYVGRDKGHKEQLMYYNIDNPKEITREIMLSNAICINPLKFGAIQWRFKDPLQMQWKGSNRLFKGFE